MAKYTQDQVDSLRRAIASGVLLVDHNGTRTRYRDLAEMQIILAAMEDDLAGKTSRRTVAVYRPIDGGFSGDNSASGGF